MPYMIFNDETIRKTVHSDKATLIGYVEDGFNRNYSNITNNKNFSLAVTEETDDESLLSMTKVYRPEKNLRVFWEGGYGDIHHMDIFNANGYYSIEDATYGYTIQDKAVGEIL